MSVVNQNTRFSFVTPNEGTHYFTNAPLGWDEVERDIKRSEKSDGIVLDITQNLEFIRDEKAFLKSQRENYGVDAIIELVKEQKYFNDYEIVDSGFIDMNTLETSKMTATASFVSNSFDAVFRSNYKEKFELNRVTDINDNSIDALVLKTMAYKSRNIFLRSELELGEAHPEFEFIEVADEYISIPATKIISSDELVKSTYRNSDNINLTVPFSGGIRPQQQQFFYYNNNQSKVLKIEIDVAFGFVWHSSPSPELQYLDILIQKSVISGGDHNPIETYTLAELNGDGTISDQRFEWDNIGDALEIEINEGECLALVYRIPAVSKLIIPTKNKILVTEDSFFDPVNIEDRRIDCITLFDAFKRVVNIMDPTVIFKSTHILTEWEDVVIFSGETARHVLYDDEKAVLGTLSFDMLFKFLFTLNPVAFGIRKKGKRTILEVEEIKYFFDDEVAINFSSLTGIKRKINTNKVYGRIEIGYSKSGKNEEIFGLQATHTVNVFGTPVTNTDNTYNAVCEFRTDPNELELCFRKQFSLFPETDTKYDKDIFAVDCKVGAGIYIFYDVRTWQDDFDSVEGIFDINSAFNYRLSPMNCLRRHGPNFKQELINKAYVGKSILYLSTKGNVALKTQIIGGDLIQEKDDILLSDLGPPIFTSEWIEGTASKTDGLINEINGGYEKQNYYKTASFINENGDKEYAYIYSIKIGNSIKTEIVQRYGF